MLKFIITLIFISLSGNISASPYFESSDFTLGGGSGAVKWGPGGDQTLGTHADVSYSWMPVVAIDETSCCGGTHDGFTSAITSFMPLGAKAAITAAFNTWSAAADISFFEVSDPGVGFGVHGGGASDIRIGGHIFDGPSSVLAHAYFPIPGEQDGTFSSDFGGDLHFDEAEAWTLDGMGGFDIFTVALHEIGHSIGLGHSLESGAVMQAFYGGPVSGLHADDIAGAQTLYGVSLVPLPAAVWLFGFGLVGLFKIGRKHE